MDTTARVFSCECLSRPCFQFKTPRPSPPIFGSVSYRSLRDLVSIFQYSLTAGRPNAPFFAKTTQIDEKNRPFGRLCRAAGEHIVWCEGVSRSVRGVGRQQLSVLRGFRPHHLGGRGGVRARASPCLRRIAMLFAFMGTADRLEYLFVSVKKRDDFHTTVPGTSHYHLRGFRGTL